LINNLLWNHGFLKFSKLKEEKQEKVDLWSYDGGWE
jgi:hypothetical protein